MTDRKTVEVTAYFGSRSVYLLIRQNSSVVDQL